MNPAPFPRILRTGFAVTGLWLAALAALPARANDRHFTYIYESAVLPPKAKEFELSTTYRDNRGELDYSRVDGRAEYEVGLTDNLMTAIYLNWSHLSEEAEPGVRSNGFKFEGVSSEWKYKFSDPVADRVGFALYEELSVGPDEYELETKLILDKRLGNELLAFNLTFEPEWEWHSSFRDAERKYEANIGWAHLFGSRWSAGIESRVTSVRTREAGTEFIAAFAGPVLHYTGKNWWFTLTAMPQLPAIKRNADTPDSPYILNDHERFNARLLLSFSF
jgi:hypothetical protein